MKKYLVAFLFIACNIGVPVNKSEKDSTVTKTAAEQFSINGCYAMTNNKDSATMKLFVKDNIVSGNLTINLFEKDKNSGAIKGIITDSLLIADYTFHSEGMTSVREVVFKIKGNALYEGYGEVTGNGNKVSFKNISELQFHNYAFTKVSCN